MYLLKFSPFFLFFFILVEGGVIQSHDGEEHGLQGSASLSLRGNGFGRLQGGYSGYGGSSGNLFGAAGNVVSGVFGAAGSVVQGVGHVTTGVVGGIAGGLSQGAGHLSGHAGYSGHQQVDSGIIGVGHQKVNAEIYSGNEYEQGAGNIVIGGHEQENDRIHFGNENEYASIGGGHINGGGLIAGQSSEHLKQSANQGSLSAVNANSFIDAGDSSRISSSKSSSSSSNKSSKRKTNSNFEGSSSNINLGAQGSSHSHDLNFNENQGFSSGVNVGHGLFGANISANKNVGLNVADASNQYSSSLLGNNSQIKGSSNTEVEESESNNQSQSETFENVKDSHLKAGSQFGSVNQSYNNQQQEADKQNAWVF